MIEGIELNIYLNEDDYNSALLSLSPVQTEVIFNAIIYCKNSGLIGNVIGFVYTSSRYLATGCGFTPYT